MNCLGRHVNLQLSTCQNRGTEIKKRQVYGIGTVYGTSRPGTTGVTPPINCAPYQSFGKLKVIIKNNNISIMIQKKRTRI